MYVMKTPNGIKYFTVGRGVNVSQILRLEFCQPKKIHVNQGG
jgi:hypothetical protein